MKPLCSARCKMQGDSVVVHTLNSSRKRGDAETRLEGKACLFRASAVPRFRGKVENVPLPAILRAPVLLTRDGIQRGEKPVPTRPPMIWLIERNDHGSGSTDNEFAFHRTEVS